MEPQPTLQEAFINLLHKNKQFVSIYLVNGVQLKGIIEAFDEQSIALKNEITQIVFKHAISTIVPSDAASSKKAD